MNLNERGVVLKPIRPLRIVGIRLIVAFSIFASIPPTLNAATVIQDKALEKKWSSISKKPRGLGVRDVAEFSLEATALQWHPERVENALKIIEEMQDRNASSKTQGNFRWYYYQPHPVDQNAVEFVVQQIISLRTLPTMVLSSGAREVLDRVLKASITGINHHKVLVSYTNIFLMKTWNLIALGESFQRDDAVAEGYRMLDEWMAYTVENGVQEYLSPTYYGTDFDSLILIFKFAKKSSGREAAGRALRLLWTQILANWFAPGERLGGPHSRDYDYLTGHGYLDRQLASWGLVNDYKQAPLNAFNDLTTWKPNASAPSLKLPRFVWQRWGNQSGQYATTYVGQTFSIGVAGACAGPEDKFFTINFGGGPKMPMANFFVDGRGDPYGQKKEVGADGHSKAHHLMPFVASAQQGAELLLFVDYDSAHPLRKQDKPVVLYSQFDIPADVALLSRDSQPVEDGETLALKEAYFLRFNDTAVGMKFILSTDISGKSLAPTYLRDGAQWKMSRITWAHATDLPVGEARVLLWISGAEGVDDASFSKFRTSFSQTSVHAEFKNGNLVARMQTLHGGELILSAEPKTGTRQTSASPSTPGVLLVDGHELGRSILVSQRSRHA